MRKIVKKKVSKPASKRPVRLYYSKKVVIGMGLLVVALFLFVTESQRFQQQRSQAAGVNCEVSASELALSPTEAQLLQMINDYRATKGAVALKTSPALMASATWLSVDSNAKNYSSHTDSLGRGISQRLLTDCGYTGTVVGENIARGTGPTAAEIFELWRTSTAGHNEEMLKPTNKVVGIAQSGLFWTFDTGNTDDTTGAPGTTTPVTSSAPTAAPSFFPLAPCPSCSNPSVIPSVGSTGPTSTIAPMPTSAEQPQPSAAVDPCEDDNAIASDNKRKHKSNNSSGFLEQIFNFLLELIKKLLELLGGSPSATPEPESPGQPSVSETPNQPCDSLPVAPSGVEPSVAQESSTQY